MTLLAAAIPPTTAPSAAPGACTPALAAAPSAPSAPAAPALVSPADLTELLAAFNDVTSRLQYTHERLTAEVVRLQGELRRANEELERSRRLAALGEMAAGIAHEVRNPLGSIRLYARMLEQDLADMPEQRGVAAKIGACVRGLDAVVGDVLAFARPTRPRPEPVDADELFDLALAAAAPEAPGGPPRPQIVHAAPPCPAVWCDPALAQQALVNVIRNALQAIDEPAATHARPRRLTLHAGPAPDAPEPGAVELAVHDTGPGLDPEALRRMFNPFFTTRRAGTGLGLAIVHRIMDAHAGRVTLRNRPPATLTPDDPGGATALLVFPAPNPAEPPSHDTPRRGAWPSDLTTPGSPA